MSKRLGMYVSSDQHLDKIIKLCQACKNKGVDVHIFLTHIGTRLCNDPRLEELKGLAHVAMCNVGFEDNKLDKDIATRVISEKDFATQARHGEMVEEVDRYLTM